MECCFIVSFDLFIFQSEYFKLNHIYSVLWHELVFFTRRFESKNYLYLLSVIIIVIILEEISTSEEMRNSMKFRLFILFRKRPLKLDHLSEVT